MGGKRYAGLDRFRLVAAALVVAIHTAPLSDLSETLDFFVTYCAGRLAVPFFLMLTGYFSEGRTLRAVRRELLWYAGATVCYLPVTVYAGQLPENLGEAARRLLFDGTYYHLWYFPAAALGLLITGAFLRRERWRAAILFAGCAYLVGVFGDSWYGLASAVPALREGYELLFSFSSYTRNGLFFAPLFLLLGALLRRRGAPGKERCLMGFLVSLALLLCEGGVTYFFGWQRHNSMYLALPAASWFLFGLLLRSGGRCPAFARDLSLFCYLVHPAGILLVRAGARLTGTTALLVERALPHFLAVLAVSAALSALLCFLKRKGEILWTRRRERLSSST